MKPLSLFILGFVLFINASAQNDSLKINEDLLPTKKHYLGIAAGFTNGLGFSYIYWPKSFGVQITALPAIIDEEFKYSAGLTILLEARKNRASRIYVYLGNQITNFMSTQNEFRYHIGIGPGIETGGENFKFHIRIGYAYYLDHIFYSSYNEVINRITFFPTIELGWFYNFDKGK